MRALFSNVVVDECHANEMIVVVILNVVPVCESYGYGVVIHWNVSWLMVLFSSWKN